MDKKSGRRCRVRNHFRVSKEKPRGEPRHNGVVYAIVVHHYLRPINRVYAKAVDLPIDHARTSIVSRKKKAAQAATKRERERSGGRSFEKETRERWREKAGEEKNTTNDGIRVRAIANRWYHWESPLGGGIIRERADCVSKRREEKGREKWGGNQGVTEGWPTKSLSFRGPITKLDCYYSSGSK